MREGRAALGALAGALLLGALAGCGGGDSGATRHRLTRPRSLPAGVLPWDGRVAVEWIRGDKLKERILIGPGGIELGPAEGPLTRYLFDDRHRSDDVRLFARSFAPFTIKGNGEELAFHGAGPAPASPAERRMIHLWAHQLVAEAVGGRGGNAYGVVLSWHRSGDAGGACDELVVDLTGEVRAGPCGSATWRGRLTDDQLRRLYAWFDAWGPFQSGAEQDQPGTSPVRLVFAGQGRAAPPPAGRTLVADFAATLYRELAARHPAPAPPPPPPVQGKPPGKPAPPPAPKASPPPPPAPEPAGSRLLRPEAPPAAHEPPPVAAPEAPPPPPAMPRPPPPGNGLL